MPNLDKTGPLGKGPKTGCGLGKCNDERGEIKTPLNHRMNIGARRGRGVGTGARRGMGRRAI